MKFLFSFLFVLLVSLASCKTMRSPEPVSIEKNTITTEVVKDTVFQLSADSTFYRAYIDCINGKPVVKNAQTTPINSGKALQPPKVSLSHNLLTVDCELKAQELFKQWKEKHISTQHNTIIPKLVEKDLSRWQIFQIWMGRIFLALILILFFKFFIKPKFL